MDNGFTFDGLHSMADWGVIAIRNNKRVIAAPGEVLSYTLGGLQGTLAFSDRQTLQEYHETVKLYADRDLGSETAATALWRQLTAWLTVGRRPLIWDSEPDKYVLAEAVDLSGDPLGWVEEGLRVTIKVQPELRSVTPSRLTATLTGGEPHSASMQVLSGLPAPVNVEIKNVGAETITGAEVTVGAGSVVLEGLALSPGDALLISMEVPAGAEILRADGSVLNALPCAVRFDRLEACGHVSVRLGITGSGARAEASVTARGVWR